MIDIHYEDVDSLPLNGEDLKIWLSSVTALHQRSLGDLNLIFCTDQYLLKINQDYLQHDYYTDIITFDYSDDMHASGDLFISVDRVRDNSENLKVHFLDELHRVIAHGVLHLCGFTDKDDLNQERMTKAEDEALRIR